MRTLRVQNRPFNKRDLEFLSGRTKGLLEHIEFDVNKPPDTVQLLAAEVLYYREYVEVLMHEMRDYSEKQRRLLRGLAVFAIEMGEPVHMIWERFHKMKDE